MKTIGLIGGTTWVSTLDYYRIINETVQETLGGFHSASCILYSIDFEETVKKHFQEWDVIAESFIDIAKRLEQAGCNLIAICANTLHIIADTIQNEINLPLIHIVDSTADCIIEKKMKKVGLIGSKYTMEELFYSQRLYQKYNIETIVPDQYEQQMIHTIIENELVYEIKKPSSKKIYINIMKNLVERGAEGIILGCTEIPLLIREHDVDIQLFDTTMIHAKAIATYALK